MGQLEMIAEICLPVFNATNPSTPLALSHMRPGQSVSPQWQMALVSSARTLKTSITQGIVLVCDMNEGNKILGFEPAGPAGQCTGGLLHTLQGLVNRLILQINNSLTHSR